MRKTILVLASLFGLASLAAAQTVADAAQKEKERREALKPGTAVIVNNVDLAKVRKKSAVTLPGEAPPASGAGGMDALPGQGGAAAQSEAMAAAGVRAAEHPVSPLEENPRAAYDLRKAALEKNWATAKERIDLLGIKMIGLQQQSNSAIQPEAREQARAALLETSKTLQDAQASEKKAKEELDRFTSGGKSGV